MKYWVYFGISLLMLFVGVQHAFADGRRVPAEWEQRECVWMQWPLEHEAELRPAFAEIIRIVTQYEPVRLIVDNEEVREEAAAFLNEADVEYEDSFWPVHWHIQPVDNAWMRDNGPVYVREYFGSKAVTSVVDWGFDAWGGNWRSAEWQNDDRIPEYVANFWEIPYLPAEEYVLERGNLESNGDGILLLNWDCQKQRNPEPSKAEHEEILKDVLGARKIIWAHGYDPEDRTTGHIDGMARFVNEDTVVISTQNTPEPERLARACEAAGLDVEWYPYHPNWLVGHEYVIAMSTGDAADDRQARRLLKKWFPRHDIHLIDAHEIEEAGGGIHCVTNDQAML